MMDNENKEYLENEFLENNNKIQICIKNKLEKNKEIFKFIFICLCFVIVFMPIEAIYKDPSNPMPIPYTLDQPDLVNMYIIAHKDFINNINNSFYKILCDDKSQFKKKYQLEIIETNKNNSLYPKRYGYCEGSKIYPIWEQYKSGNLDSRYIGICHYRRVFSFKNNMLNLDEIFMDHDVILNSRLNFLITNREVFNNHHLVHLLDEVVDIIEEKFPEYAPYAKLFLNKKWGNYCNIFIMKKKDFIKWGEFVYGVLFEFDKRHNLTNDQEIRNFITKEVKKSNRNLEINYQSRIQGFLMERIGNIFYDKHFSKRYELPIVDN